MNLPKLKLGNISPRGLFVNHPVAFWIMFGIIILLSGIAIWGKWSFNYRIIDIKLDVNRNYCQQDSDCVLVSKYEGCCPGCEIEAVNIETKDRDMEVRNKLCSTKDYSCPKFNCVLSIDKWKAVCEQNRCVAKEKQPANVNTDNNVIL